MTRAELEQVREALADATEFGCRVAYALPNSNEVWQDAWPENWGQALKLLDRELATPEVREWGTKTKYTGHVYREPNELAAREMAAEFKRYRVVSRTPAGPWEPAE